MPATYTANRFALLREYQKVWEIYQIRAEMWKKLTSQTSNHKVIVKYRFQRSPTLFGTLQIAISNYTINAQDKIDYLGGFVILYT